jgi:hypothetical protein
LDVAAELIIICFLLHFVILASIFASIYLF